MIEVRVDDLSGSATRELIALHRAGMQANSPAENVFALDLSGLMGPEITVLSAWIGDQIAGIGAIRILPDGSGEVKSMRTHPDFLRQGVAAAVLESLIDLARAHGLRRLSLETGTGPAFEPALTLYRRRGFVRGEAFGDYSPSDFNQFFHLEI